MEVFKRWLTTKVKITERVQVRITEWGPFEWKVRVGLGKIKDDLYIAGDLEDIDTIFINGTKYVPDLTIK